MLKTAKLLTITVPKSTYTAIHDEAKKRQDTVSGMLRRAFNDYVENSTELYSDRELDLLLKRDKLSTGLKQDLDRLLNRQ